MREDTMRFIHALVLAGAALLSWAGSASAQEVVESLRGGHPISATSRTDSIFRPEKDQELIPRNFQKQPPLIPHSIKGYNITQNFNKCMDCHSRDRAEGNRRYQGCQVALPGSRRQEVEQHFAKALLLSAMSRATVRCQASGGKHL